MPYFHIDCGGEIGLWTRKCHKCKKVWPLRVLFAPKVPKDMVMVKKPRGLPRWTMMGRGKTPYAKWADSAPPGTAELASRLPNWPRWARFLTVVMLVLLITMIVVLIRR